MTQAILFVCLGNICRSPTAQAVVDRLAQEAGLSLHLDSAGTGGWHAGEPPHPPMIAAARARGYDLSAQRARQLRPEDFQRFDRIFVMDRQNLKDAQSLRRVKARDQGAMPELFLSLVPDCGLTEMPDPWYSHDFDQTLDLCERAGQSLIDELIAETPG